MKLFVEANGIVMLKADNTKEPDDITDLLVKLKNTSMNLPFYAIFPANDPSSPIVMDGLFTSPARFIEKLRQAGPSRTAPPDRTAGTRSEARGEGG